MLAFRSSFALALLVGACSSGTGLPDNMPIDAPPATGQFSVTWSLQDGARALTCTDVGATLLTVRAISPSTGVGVVEAFTCATGAGVSRRVTPGDYDLSFELDGKSGTLATPTTQRVKVPANGVIAATPLAISLSATGSINARVVAGATANCAAGGANISAMSLALEKGGVCVPTTFTIAAAGGRPGGTYNSTCATPPPTTACIERDQAITATTGSGEYTVRVRGIVGATPCWLAGQLADIPPLGRTLSASVGLAYQNGTAGCP